MPQAFWGSRRLAAGTLTAIALASVFVLFIHFDSAVEEIVLVPQNESFVPPVIINPGDPVQAITEYSPAGSVFLFKSGVHYLAEVRPKDGDVFLGEQGAALSGARLLESFGREGNLWVASGLTQQGPARGRCEPEYPACEYPEDLFIDDMMLKRITSKLPVVPGTWYFDYDSDRAYFADNPAGRKVEISVLPHAFQGSARDVAIRGLVIEKYATPSQMGAINGRIGDLGKVGSAWRIESSEIRLNHASGIVMGTRNIVADNYIHRNGQLGLKGGGEDSLVERNTIVFNNTAGFDWGWEAGGAKFTETTNLIVRENVVAHNFGRGLWTDINNIHTVYENNKVFNNFSNGLFHEISYDAVIRGNVLWGNGLGKEVWLWGGQITLANSRNVEIYDNMVIVPSEGGDGITLIQQQRPEGPGRYGAWLTANNYIHHNSVVYLGGKGQTGAAADFAPDILFEGKNQFDWNKYYARDSGDLLWEWEGALDWQGWRDQGHDANGQLRLN